MFGEFKKIALAIFIFCFINVRKNPLKFSHVFACQNQMTGPAKILYSSLRISFLNRQMKSKFSTRSQFTGLEVSTRDG